MTLPAGTYKLEVWGAAGGAGRTTADTGNGTGAGKGGYATGILTVSGSTTLYVAVGRGGAPGLVSNINPTSSTQKTDNAWNGGGFGRGIGGGGGGATHIGLKSGLLTTFESDYVSNLLLVGGGGGGFTEVSQGSYNAGYRWRDDGDLCKW